jgi:hypothetical protein
MPLPVGLVYDPGQRVVLDPDKQLQNTLRHFFETFRRTGAAWATMQSFAKEELKFPRRGQAGSGELLWERPRLSATLDTLHNPRYAGAFCFGKTRSWKDPQGGRHCVDLPREQWAILIKDAHPGYISWEQFEENQSGCNTTSRRVALDGTVGRRGKARPCSRAWSFAASAVGR